MHRDHNIFVQAIREKRKLKMTFFSKDLGRDVDRICGPVFYSASAGGDDSGCYLLWDFECGAGNSFMALPPSKIVSMDITEEPFDMVAFFTSGSAVNGS
jgi:hypothetical protein